MLPNSSGHQLNEFLTPVRFCHLNILIIPKVKFEHLILQKHDPNQLNISENRTP